MHVKSLKVDFFGLPSGRFGLAVRRNTSVGRKRLSAWELLWLRARRPPFKEIS